MKIICTNNQYSILPEYLQQVYISNDGRDLNPRLEDITIAKTYVVYATAALNGYPGYFICDNYREYPICHQTFCNPRYQNKFPRMDESTL